MSKTFIVGIALLKNEEFFAERAILNTLDFCDRFIAVDNHSSDATPEILKRLEVHAAGKLTVHLTNHPGISHDLIKEYAGTNTWIFAVDGDEIYDPEGLKRLRLLLEKGGFDQDWCIFGNVLNVRSLDLSVSLAEGYLAPPCRSMTKLYNFAAIKSWEGPCQERLHGGKIIFKEGFDEKMRRGLHEEFTWEASPFRCLHLCFLRRSGLDKQDGSRANIMDRHAWSLSKVISKIKSVLNGKKPPNWKEEKYARGPLVEKHIEAFFPSDEA